jgi:hypothetical protein
MAGAILVLGAGASLAQPAPPEPGRQPGMERERPDPAARAERHAQKLRDVLQLTPQQEPALRALMDAMKPPGDWREKMAGRGQEMEGLTTPQRLDRMRERMVERQQAFDTRAMAIKRFYGQLSPSQKKAFDAMRPMGDRGHGMRGYGKGGPGTGHHGGGRGPMGPGGPDGPEGPGEPG